MELDGTVREIMNVRVYEARVVRSRHRKRVGDRVYEWVTKRVTVPREVEDTTVYIIPSSEFAKLISCIKKLIEIASRGDGDGGKA